MASLVFPFHDTDGSQTKLLLKILPTLKQNFKNSFVSITPKTRPHQEIINVLESDPFFVLNFNEDATSIGDHFVSGYRNAAEKSLPDEILHLCTSDRLSFALLNGFSNTFLKDTVGINSFQVPLLFQRSKTAWKTHPRNYQAMESMVTELGRVLFGDALDYCWCHLAVSCADLRKILPRVKAHDFVILAEIILLLKNKITTKEVDWLSWEDPFILDKDPKSYKMEREKDPLETKKRMDYVLPQINYLLRIFSEE